METLLISETLLTLVVTAKARVTVAKAPKAAKEMVVKETEGEAGATALTITNCRRRKAPMRLSQRVEVGPSRRPRVILLILGGLAVATGTRRKLVRRTGRAR